MRQIRAEGEMEYNANTHSLIVNSMSLTCFARLHAQIRRVLFLTVFILCVLCVQGATFSVEGGQAKGQRGSALLRSPLFPPPLRNAPCSVSRVYVIFILRHANANTRPDEHD